MLCLVLQIVFAIVLAVYVCCLQSDAALQDVLCPVGTLVTVKEKQMIVTLCKKVSRTFGTFEVLKNYLIPPFM